MSSHVYGECARLDNVDARGPHSQICSTVYWTTTASDWGDVRFFNISLLQEEPFRVFIKVWTHMIGCTGRLHLLEDGRARHFFTLARFASCKAPLTLVAWPHRPPAPSRVARVCARAALFGPERVNSTPCSAALTPSQTLFDQPVPPATPLPPSLRACRGRTSVGCG